jgi:hypothetical protein
MSTANIAHHFASAFFLAGLLGGAWRLGWLWGGLTLLGLLVAGYAVGSLVEDWRDARACRADREQR